VPHVTLRIDSFTSYRIKEEIMGDKYETGDVYGGIVGGHVHDVNMTQTWNQLRANLDLAELGQQLSVLRAELLKDARDHEQFAPVGALASAELEAKEGNGPKALEYLSKAGKWALDVATKVGETVAAEALKRAHGIRP